jgi:hypothetical protein
MATAHVTRARGARSARTRATPKTSSAARHAIPRPVPRTSTPAHRPKSRPAELSAALADVARRLEVLYSTCVTVQLALKAQNAEQDADISRCLMQQVTEPLCVQAQALHAIVGRLKRPPLNGQPVRP